MGTIGTSYGNKNAWERLKIRDPKNPPETLEFQSFRTSNSERHPASTFWIVLVYCQMMSSVRFCHLKHKLCPTKTLTCTILVLDRAWSAAKPVPLAACWMCLCTMYLNSPHSLVRTVRRSFFRHAFTWFLIEVNSNSWSASRYHDSISPQPYSSGYCDMISQICPQQQSISEVQRVVAIATTVCDSVILRAWTSLTSAITRCIGNFHTNVYLKLCIIAFTNGCSPEGSTQNL